MFAKIFLYLIPLLIWGPRYVSPHPRASSLWTSRNILSLRPVETAQLGDQDLYVDNKFQSCPSPVIVGPSWKGIYVSATSVCVCVCVCVCRGVGPAHVIQSLGAPTGCRQVDCWSSCGNPISCWSLNPSLHSSTILLELPLMLSCGSLHLFP